MTVTSAVFWAAGVATLATWISTTASPTVVWHVTGEARGTPATDGANVYFASRRHEVVALDAATGRERWRRSTAERGEETFGFAVVVAGSVVAVGDYNLVGFDRVSGALRWRFEPEDGHATGVYVGAVAGGLVLTGSPAGRMYAVEPESGRARWTSLISDDRRTTVFQPIANGEVAVAGFTQFTAPNRGGVVAVNLKTGVVRWKMHFPVPADRTLSTNFGTGAVFYSDLVLASSGDGLIHAIDATTGERRWAIDRVGNLPPGWLVSPDRDNRPLAIVGDTLVSGSLTGAVIAYDLATRRERWRFHSRMSGSTVYRLTADDRMVYVPYFGGEFIALDLAKGTEQWRIGDWRSGFLWAPLIWNDKVFVAASGSGYYAFAHPRAPE